MKIVFVSNFFNHHQKPFSDAMYRQLGEGYFFIETGEMSEARKNLGWGINESPVYVISADELYKSFNRYLQLINDADCVIIGSAPENLIQERIKTNKLIFRYSERPLKKGLELWKYPIRWMRWHKQNPKSKKIYMLCASAYTSSDYAKFDLFKNKCYKWGYFPEVKKYEDVERLIASKEQASILWCSRLIDWKHPEVAIEIARRLKSDGYQFSLNMIGIGDLFEVVQNQIAENHLDDCVYLFGSMKPEQVRGYMEQSEIFLFTSDRNEGWGAVLNESMNSGCAVVANHAIGSVPFLIQDGKNGLIYRDGDVDALYDKVKYLLSHWQERAEMGKNAYLTIAEEWNAENAATKFVELSKRLLNGEKHPFPYSDGVCSKSEILKDHWYVNK